MTDLLLPGHDLVSGGNVANRIAPVKAVAPVVKHKKIWWAATYVAFALALVGTVAFAYLSQWVHHVTSTATSYSNAVTLSPNPAVLLMVTAAVLLSVHIGLLCWFKSRRVYGSEDIYMSFIISVPVTLVLVLFSFLIGIIVYGLNDHTLDMNTWVSQTLHVKNLTVPDDQGKFYTVDTAGNRLTLNYQSYNGVESLTLLHKVIIPTDK